MTAPCWTQAENSASEAEILAHLARCDARFEPPLSGRVELSAYAHRLCERAHRFEAWADDQLVGLVAAYLDGADDTAFVSNVSVEDGFLGHGIASSLLTWALERASITGLARIQLYVGSSSVAARRLYEKHGFHACRVEGEQILMQRNLAGAVR